MGTYGSQYVCPFGMSRSTPTSGTCSNDSQCRQLHHYYTKGNYTYRVFYICLQWKNIQYQIGETAKQRLKFYVLLRYSLNCERSLKHVILTTNFLVTLFFPIVDHDMQIKYTKMAHFCSVCYKNRIKRKNKW